MMVPNLRRRRVARLSIFAGGAFLLFICIALGVYVEALSTAHRVPLGSPPGAFADRYEPVTFTTSDGLKLSAWYIPGIRPEGLVLIHGINFNRFGLMPEALVLAEAGYHLIMPDLRGHGVSEGRLISYGYYEALDVQAAADFLLAQPGVERIAAVGTSFGGSAVAHAAAYDERLAGVIIQSSFSDLNFAIERSFTNFTGLPQWPFAPIISTLMAYRMGIKATDVDAARDLALVAPRPVMIIHGTQDHLFEVAHAERMYEAIVGPKSLWLVEGMGHGSPVHVDRAMYQERVFAFFEQVFAES